MATYKVPFLDGSLLHDVDNWYIWRKEAIDWKDPEPFYAWLAIDSMCRSGHAVYYMWKDKELQFTYPMLANEMLELLQTTDVVNGLVRGKWIVVKHGRAYGIRKVDND